MCRIQSSDAQQTCSYWYLCFKTPLLLTQRNSTDTRSLSALTQVVICLLCQVCVKLSPLIELCLQWNVLNSIKIMNPHHLSCDPDMNNWVFLTEPGCLSAAKLLFGHSGAVDSLHKTKTLASRCSWRLQTCQTCRSPVLNPGSDLV